MRVAFSHACLQWIADEAGIDILHFKGVALTSELRADRIGGTDADVLVRPGQLRAFVRALEAHGWQRRTTFEQGSVFGHAALFFHPLWGTCDLHRSYPGIDADRAGAFAALWEESEFVRIGDADCRVPSEPAQRLILILHAVRSHGAQGPDVQRAWHAAAPEMRARIEEQVERLAGHVAWAAFTGEWEGLAGRPGLHVWQAIADGEDPSHLWGARLQDARGVRGRARVLGQALQVNRDHLALRLQREPRRSEVATEFFARWVRAAGRVMAARRR